MTINKKIYTLAMIEMLINNKKQTDLNTHTLEYDFKLSDVLVREKTNACLAIAVRLRNKKTGLLDWGSIYYKSLIENDSICKISTFTKVRNILKKLSCAPTNKKMDFIFKLETKVLETPYIRGNYVYPIFYLFFENLNRVSADGYPIVYLNGKIPRKAIKSIEKSYEEITENKKASDYVRKR